MAMETFANHNTEDDKFQNSTTQSSTKLDSDELLQQYYSSILPEEMKEARKHYYKKDRMKIFLEKALEQQTSLSFTKHSEAWSNSATDNNTTYTSDMEQIISPTKPVQFYPSDKDIVLFVNSENKQRQLESYLKKLHKELEAEGFVLASHRAFQDRSTEIQVEGHLLDLFVVDRPGRLSLYSIFDKDITTTEQAALLSNVRQLKFKLMKLIDVTSTKLNAISFVIDNKNITLGKDDQEIPRKSKDALDRDKFLHPRQNEPFFDCLQKAVMHHMLSSDSYFKQGLDSELQHKLTKQQVDKLLPVEYTQLNLFIGPPGCGKSVMARAMYEQFEPHVWYCVTTEPFKSFLEYHGIKKVQVVQYKEDLLSLAPGYKYLIIDDTQNIAGFAESDWRDLLEMVMKNDVTLLMFGDSKYQNFAHEKSLERVKELMEECASQNKIKCNVSSLSDIHRNGKKVVSFIHANLMTNASEGKEHDDITCPHIVNGDDVLIIPVKDLRENNKRNGLLQLVLNLLGKERYSIGYNHNMRYNASDIAILIDGDGKESDLKFFMELFASNTDVPVQRARYPVQGVIFEILDEFYGLDSSVVIHVQGMTTDPKRTMNNGRYKTFVASRGINLVIFVKDEPTTLAIAEDMKFDSLKSVVIDKYANFFTTPGELPAILTIIREEMWDVSSLPVLKDAWTAVTSKGYDKEAATIFVKDCGIGIALSTIQQLRDNETEDARTIRERALIALSEVALHKELSGNLMNKEVIDKALDRLAADWVPESWEACYLLAKLISVYHKEWSISDCPVNKCLKLIDGRISQWRVDETCAVAYAELDYTVYYQWLSQKDFKELQYLAAWTLLNLVKTKKEREVPKIITYITLERLENLVQDSEVDDKVKVLVHEVWIICSKLRAIPTAHHRDYKTTASLENWT